MKRLVGLMFLLLLNTAAAFQSIVVLPFSNRSKQEQVYWLGEGFAESLSEEMLLHDAYVIQRRQRLSAYSELHLPYSGDLSRATMLKVADRLSVDYVIFGSYNFKDSAMEVEARVVKIATSELSPVIKASGSLDRLYEIQNAIRDELVKYFQGKNLQPENLKAFVNHDVPLHAYELYIKGVMEDSDLERVKFLERAVAENPGYPQAGYRLGLALFRLQRYQESSEALRKASMEGAFKDRAEFQIALNSFYSGDYEAARQIWLELSKSGERAELLNNIGVALLKKEDVQGAGWYLSRAVELDPTVVEYHFNLACSYVLRNYDRQAVQQFREAIQGHPADYQSFYLISKLLERDPDPIQKNMISKKIFQVFQQSLPSDLKGKFPEQYNTVGQLLRPVTRLLSEEERQYEDVFTARGVKELNNIVKAYESRAAGYIAKEEPANAISELKKGTSLDPFNWRLRYLWGRGYMQQKDREAAISELELSIWCKENVESHLLLAEIYRDSEKYAESKLQVQRSLALDPENKKALEIWGKIWDKQ